ncbi:MAG: hypothetical protein NTW37_14655 [Proteobacteria bacterium]|nr:hypothetical protein [Pseudomonadota bacterium]
MILKSAPDEPEVIQAGTTEAEITKRLGSPIEATRLESPARALDLREKDRHVSVSTPGGVAVSKSVFAFKGRLESKARAGQAGFDSFMTLGLAEIYLIPKALWERLIDDDLQLTVWFNAVGQAVAYKWDQRTKN